MKNLTRRQLFKETAIASAAALLLSSGCAPAGKSAKPAAVKAFPAAPKSTVVRARHTGVWSGDTLQPAVLTQLLDASITKLTGQNDALQAWKSVFRPTDKIAIKVNTIDGSIDWTHVPLVNAVVARLLDAGFPGEQLFVFDRHAYELTGAGFTINKDGPGARLVGTDGDYTSGIPLMDTKVGISNILMNCDALINMPLVKQHMYTGVSFSMKNHYGTFDSPDDFHYGQRIEQGLAELNALPAIKDKTRLIIGDALVVVLGDNWTSEEKNDSIFMSFDPVATDMYALKLLAETKAAKGADESVIAEYAAKAKPWLAHAVELGLGTTDPAKIDYQELKLG